MSDLGRLATHADHGYPPHSLDGWHERPVSRNCTPETRGHVVGWRNALPAATIVIAFIFSCGTMMGPLMANMFGLREVLVIISILRLASGVALVRWG